MGISNNASGLRPGVCTSTTRPTAPYTGQIIFETDTGYLRVWDGSAWDYLSQSQNDTVGLGAVGGLVFIKSQTVGTAVSSATITNVFSSTYDNYRLIVSNVDSSVAATSLFMRFDAGGTTNYYSSVYYDAYTGTDTATLRRSAQASGGIGTSGPDNDTSVSIDIYLPNVSNRTTWSGTFSASGLQGWCGGTTVVTTQYTDVTILPNSGTLTGGTIKVYGYRNS